MRRLALVGSLCTTLLAALPAAGGTILYATAASLNRVDGFCVGAGGGFVPGANIVPSDTKGTEPRRLLVAPGPGGVDGVLYGRARPRRGLHDRSAWRAQVPGQHDADQGRAPCNQERAAYGRHGHGIQPRRPHALRGAERP